MRILSIVHCYRLAERDLYSLQSYSDILFRLFRFSFGCHLMCVWDKQVGWWVGLAEGGNDPYGRIINIYAAHGRLVAKGYSARFDHGPFTCSISFFEFHLDLRAPWSS